MKRYVGPIVLAIVGVVIGIIGVVMFFGKVGDIVDLANSGTFTAPGEQTMTLNKGEFVAAELTGSDYGSGDSFGSATGIPTLSYEHVTVTGPSGPVAVRCGDCGIADETITLGSDVYKPFARFTVDQPGQYTVAVTQGVGIVAITPSLTEIVSGFGAPFIPIGIGSIMVLAALIWLIVAFFTRPKKATLVAATPVQGGIVTPPTTSAATNWQPPAAAPIPPPVDNNPAPGWYPDPDVPGQRRWWDGNRWTDQTYPGSG